MFWLPTFCSHLILFSSSLECSFSIIFFPDDQFYSVHFNVSSPRLSIYTFTRVICPVDIWEICPILFSVAMSFLAWLAFGHWSKVISLMAIVSRLAVHQVFLFFVFIIDAFLLIFIYCSRVGVRVIWEMREWVEAGEIRCMSTWRSNISLRARLSPLTLSAHEGESNIKESRKKLLFFFLLFVFFLVGSELDCKLEVIRIDWYEVRLKIFWAWSE